MNCPKGNNNACWLAGVENIIAAHADIDKDLICVKELSVPASQWLNSFLYIENPTYVPRPSRAWYFMINYDGLGRNRKKNF